jgi:hypothetical protein
MRAERPRIADAGARASGLSPLAIQWFTLRPVPPRAGEAALHSSMEWTLEDLRRFLLDRPRRERWLAAVAQLRARNLTNFGDLR